MWAWMRGLRNRRHVPIPPIGTVFLRDFGVFGGFGWFR